MWSKFLCAFLLFANMASGNELYGDCSAVNQRELIWQYIVRRPPSLIQFQTVEAQYETTRATISCIDVTSIGQDSGVARITSGGVGRNNVKFNIVTTRGKSINVKILVYGH